MIATCNMVNVMILFKQIKKSMQKFKVLKWGAISNFYGIKQTELYFKYCTVYIPNKHCYKKDKTLIFYYC